MDNGAVIVPNSCNDTIIWAVSYKYQFLLKKQRIKFLSYQHLPRIKSKIMSDPSIEKNSN